MALYFSEYKKRFPGDVFFYGNASHAFYEVLVWLQNNRPRAKPNIVLPVFIPAKLYRFVLAAEYEPKFYDMSLDCQVDVNRIDSLIDEQTQAVFCVHYFGIPAVLSEIKHLAALKNIFLIEDCAHTLNSNRRGKELGSIGDCAIFSSRKMLQLPAGGFLMLNKKPWEFKPGYSKRVKSMFTACKFIQSRTKYAYYCLTKGHDPLNLAWIPRTGYIDFSEEQRVCTKNISRLNKAHIHSVNLETVAERRRKNYEYLLNGLKDLSYLEIMPVSAKTSDVIWEIGSTLRLKKGITPYSFPVLVPSRSRSRLLRILCETGIGCGAGWPESPFGHSGFDHSAELSERLLELPIHQGMNRHQLNRIIDCLHYCAKRETYKMSTSDKQSEVA